MSKELAERKYFDYVAVPDRETRAFLKKRAEYGKALLKRTAQGVWEMGQLLSEVRERLPHGQFGVWIEAELGLTHHSANNFMRVFQRFPDLLQNVNNLHFEVAPTILYLLAAPSVSDEQREEIVEEIMDGEIVPTVANVKERLNVNQPPIPASEPIDHDDFPCPFDEDEDEESKELSAPENTITETPQEQYEAAPVDLAEALPLYVALQSYGHKGHLFLSAAVCWYELEEARRKFAYAHSRVVPRHASGTVFDEWKAFLRIPDPGQWEGCAACKGSTRVGDGELCLSCKGGFTTHPGEGVSADVVASYAEQSATV